MRDLIWSYIEKVEVGRYRCTVCGLVKTSTGLTALKNHVESKHLEEFSIKYNCDYCSKVMHSANAYHTHLQKVHKNK